MRDQIGRLRRFTAGILAATAFVGWDGAGILHAAVVQDGLSSALQSSGLISDVRQISPSLAAPADALESHLFIQLTGFAIPGTTDIGTITMVGSNGNYLLQTVSGISGDGGVNGKLAIVNLNPPDDSLTFGLTTTGAISQGQFINDLNSAIQVSDADAVAEAPTGATGAIIAGLGENVELFIPAHSTAPSLSTLFLSFDLREYDANASNGNVSFSQITVFPEPTMVGLLAICGFLLSRRLNRG